MTRIRLLSIMPYHALVPIVARIAAQSPEIELVTNQVGLVETGAELVSGIPESHYDAVISRGATKQAIERVTHKPVFEIPVSYFDLIRILSLMKNYEGRPAFVCYRNLADQIKALKGFLAHDYETIVIRAGDNLAPVMSSLKSKGYTMVVGDAAATAFASAAGLQTMLISSSPESVAKCFEEIRQVFAHYDTARLKSMLFEDYLSDRQEQLIVLSPEKKIVYSNNYFLPAERFLTFCPAPAECFASPDPIAANFSLNNMFYSVISTADRRQYVFCRILRTPVQASGSRSRFKSLQTTTADEVSASYEDSQTFIVNLVNRVMQEFQSTVISGRPILITSESGLEKTRMACMLFLRSAPHGSTLTTINCASFSTRELHYLLEDITSPILSLNSYVLFKDAQLLSPALFEELVNGLKNFVDSVSSHLMFTYELSYHADDKNLDRYNINTLKNTLGCSEIPLKPLRSNVPDIQNYAILYIKQKQEEGIGNVVGIEPEATDILQEYPWPRNLNQLQHVLDEAILSAHTPWITADSIRRILQNEDSSLLRSSGPNTIAIDGTLDDMTREIVSRVLSEEKQNRTRAAERLGISRTTLWRILQS